MDNGPMFDEFTSIWLMVDEWCYKTNIVNAIEQLSHQGIDQQTRYVSEVVPYHKHHQHSFFGSLMMKLLNGLDDIVLVRLAVDEIDYLCRVDKWWRYLISVDAWLLWWLIE